MASTNPGSPLVGSVYPSCGRGFAAVDPERQREVVCFARVVTREALSPARVRPATPQWFNPPRARREEGASSR